MLEQLFSVRLTFFSILFFFCRLFKLLYGLSDIIYLLPPSFVGGGGFISSFDTQRVTHCTPVQSIHNVINTQLQNMKVFKVLVKIYLLATVITKVTMSGGITNKNVMYDSIVFCLQKHPVHYRIFWEKQKLTILIGKLMPLKIGLLFMVPL